MEPKEDLGAALPSSAPRYPQLRYLPGFWRLLAELGSQSLPDMKSTTVKIYSVNHLTLYEEDDLWEFGYHYVILSRYTESTDKVETRTCSEDEEKEERDYCPVLCRHILTCDPLDKIYRDKMNNKGDVTPPKKPKISYAAALKKRMGKDGREDSAVRKEGEAAKGPEGNSNSEEGPPLALADNNNCPLNIAGTFGRKKGRELMPFGGFIIKKKTAAEAARLSEERISEIMAFGSRTPAVTSTGTGTHPGGTNIDNLQQRFHQDGVVIHALKKDAASRWTFTFDDPHFGLEQDAWIYESKWNPTEGSKFKFPLVASAFE